MSSEDPHLLTTGQAAEYCSVTADTVLKWIKRGRLQGLRTAGGHHRIDPRELEAFLASSRGDRDVSSPNQQTCSTDLRCWEYLSDRGTIREECQQCVVYRVRAARCFMLADEKREIGHARRFCRTSCEDCCYYRRVRGLASNVLVVTRDEELVSRLVAEAEESVTLSFARNWYEASATINDFRPAFLVIDAERIAADDSELLDSLASDPRVPGLRIMIAVPHGTAGRKRRWPKSDLIIGVLERPFGSRRVATVINGALLALPAPDVNPR